MHCATECPAVRVHSPAVNREAITMASRLRVRIDFDEWCRLARENPDAFEERRLAMIETAIRTAPTRRQQRLRGLQWRIDHARRRARTPMAACMTLSRMMWETIQGENGLLAAMETLSARWHGDRRVPLRHQPPARILSFRRPGHPES